MGVDKLLLGRMFNQSHQIQQHPATARMQASLACLLDITCRLLHGFEVLREGVLLIVVDSLPSQHQHCETVHCRFDALGFGHCPPPRQCPPR